MNHLSRPKPSEIRAALLARDVQLNPPATAVQLASLEASIGQPLNSFARSIYESFNGFANDDFDVGPFLSVWPIEKIIGTGREFVYGTNFPFADTHWDALIYVQSASDPELPVLEGPSGEVISRSTFDFWTDLTSGRLDATRRDVP